jgi:thiol-disulfide isomerase/thioredoxin
MDKPMAKLTIGASTDDSNAPNGRRHRRWGRRLRRLGLEVAIVLLVLTAVHWYRARPLADGMAPGLGVNGLEPLAQINLSLPPSNGPTLVHFWASWCPICKLEEGSIEALGERYKVITVAMQSGTDEEISRYLSERGLNLQVIADPNGELARQWGVQAVPASFIIDRDGRIRFRRIGYTTGVGLRARLWLAGIGNSLDGKPGR